MNDATDYLQSLEPVEPRLVESMPEAEYRSVEAFGSTAIKRASETIDDLLAYLNEDDQDDTKAKRIGRALHLAVLEPDRFADTFDIPDPPVDPSDVFYLRRKAARHVAGGEDDPEVIGEAISTKTDTVAGYLEEDEVQQLADFWAEHPPDERPDINPDTLDDVRRMRDSIKRHPLVRGGLLSGGASEVSFFWNAKSTGGRMIPAKGRADYLIDHGDYWVVIDIKTTSKSPRPGAYDRAAGRYSYHLQARWYADGLEKITGKPVAHFLHVAVEKSAPFKAAIHRMGPAKWANGTDDEPDTVAARKLWQGAGDRLYASDPDEPGAIKRVCDYIDDPSGWTGIDPSIHQLELKPWEI